MQKYKNLTIIGSSHIAIESIKEIENYINNYKPGIIALELDRKRFVALFKKERPRLKDIVHLGIKGFLINLFGAYIEKKLGKLVGVKPGDEMRKAIALASNYNAQIALIDQNIDITLKKLGNISLKEKFRIFLDVLQGLLFRKDIADIKKFDLTKVPSKEIIDKLINKVKRRYPEVYNILIKERNEIMTKALNKIISLNPEAKILAIVGAGHEKELVKLLQRG
ncbi:MAG: TraB/GumN family protein [Nanoarchaeota archaeon]